MLLNLLDSDKITMIICLCSQSYLWFQPPGVIVRPASPSSTTKQDIPQFKAELAASIAKELLDTGNEQFTILYLQNIFHIEKEP